MTPLAFICPRVDDDYLMPLVKFFSYYKQQLESSDSLTKFDIFELSLLLETSSTMVTAASGTLVCASKECFYLMNASLNNPGLKHSAHFLY
jgi:hypothetical protein